MNSRPSSTKIRRDCFDAHRKADETGRIYLQCWLCGGRIYPGNEGWEVVDVEDWEADHTVRRVVGGSDGPENVMPAHVRCHAVKTKLDIVENAKGKRVAEKHFGIKRATGWNKRFKKKLNGTVVARDEK